MTKTPEEQMILLMAKVGEIILRGPSAEDNDSCFSASLSLLVRYSCSELKLSPSQALGACSVAQATLLHSLHELISKTKMENGR